MWVSSAWEAREWSECSDNWWLRNRDREAGGSFGGVWGWTCVDVGWWVDMCVSGGDGHVGGVDMCVGGWVPDLSVIPTKT